MSIPRRFYFAGDTVFEQADGSDHALCLALGQTLARDSEAVAKEIADALNEAQQAIPCPCELRPIEDWHDDDGEVLWWTWPIHEAPYVGSPLCSDWPDTHRFWSPLPDPNRLTVGGKTSDKVEGVSRVPGAPADDDMPDELKPFRVGPPWDGQPQILVGPGAPEWCSSIAGWRISGLLRTEEATVVAERIADALNEALALEAVVEQAQDLPWVGDGPTPTEAGRPTILYRQDGILHPGFFDAQERCWCGVDSRPVARADGWRRMPS